MFSATFGWPHRNFTEIFSARKLESMPRVNDCSRMCSDVFRWHRRVITDWQSLQRDGRNADNRLVSQSLVQSCRRVIKNAIARSCWWPTIVIMRSFVIVIWCFKLFAVSTDALSNVGEAYTTVARAWTKKIEPQTMASLTFKRRRSSRQHTWAT